ncbi:MAG: CoB--CoM heterodisulfide reductase iron-sulfur subunit A family protein [Bacteroidales bacterium]|jgi:heterodisulfide reductase subunit A|nr:CoB--CoM heterodisulfide reductase iron-sulfur subunit A family protein [Bacteroidales bacterium]
MDHKDSIGVFFFDLMGTVNDPINYSELAKYTLGFQQVLQAWHYSDFPWNEETIRKKIETNDLSKIIVAGALPGTVKTLFSKAMSMAGKNPSSVILVSFNEYGIWSDKEIERAKALLICAIRDIPYEIAAMPGDAPVNPATMIIGGGISGIQAALEIANGNTLVYLIEKTGTIGGKMATFDKTFPTLDCAACILTPKMVEVNQHPNIRLMSYCEVREVTGDAGNFTVKLLQKARKVNVTTCIGCGTCAEKCPATAPSEFDSGTTMRKAIYMPFPQAVPNKYLIDAESCIYLKTGKCRACVKACPVPDCINLDEPDKEVLIKVGNIIVATGYKTFDAARMEQYGYGKYPNVLAALEFERLLNASGPTGGNIHYRTQDKKGNWIFSTEAEKPEKLAIIHCVGSRDKNYNKYCSRVCCMYSLKFAHLILDKLPEAEVFEYFIDMRSFGKGYEEFYERIKEEGVSIIRGKTAKVEAKNGKLLIRGEDILRSELIENIVDMVILSTGLEPGEDTKKISEMLGIPTSDGGWLEEANYNTDPTGTFRGGIMLAGTCQGPKDIPDSVAQGSAAAARVIQNILRGRVTKDISGLTLEEIENHINEISPIQV